MRAPLLSRAVNLTCLEGRLTSAATTATRTYDAFGLLTASTGTPQGPFGFVGAQGYQEDGDTGLKLLGHRYYDPSTGRFLSRDPARQGRNWYGYANNRPTTAIDPDGRLTFSFPANDSGFGGSGWLPGPSRYPYGRQWISPDDPTVSIDYHWTNPTAPRGGWSKRYHWHASKDGVEVDGGDDGHFAPGEDGSPVPLPEPVHGPPPPDVNPGPTPPEIDPSSGMTPAQEGVIRAEYEEGIEEIVEVVVHFL